MRRVFTARTSSPATASSFLLRDVELGSGCALLGVLQSPSFTSAALSPGLVGLLDILLIVNLVILNGLASKSLAGAQPSSAIEFTYVRKLLVGQTIRVPNVLSNTSATAFNDIIRVDLGEWIVLLVYGRYFGQGDESFGLGTNTPSGKPFALLPGFALNIHLTEDQLLVVRSGEKFVELLIRDVARLILALVVLIFEQLTL